MITIYVDEAQEITQEQWDKIFKTVMKDRICVDCPKDDRLEPVESDEEQCACPEQSESEKELECALNKGDEQSKNLEDIFSSLRELGKLGVINTRHQPIPTNVRDFKYRCPWYQSLSDAQFEALMKHVLLCERFKK